MTTTSSGPAHQRPDLAGDGQLLLPAKVAFDHHGFLRGRTSGRVVDPFESTADRLLLAESFARLDLADRLAAKRWFVEHGVVDFAAWTDGRSRVPHEDWLVTSPPGAIADRLGDIAVEQHNVRWHLDTLGRLSERRVRMDWDPAFGRVILASPAGRMIVGGPHAGSMVASPLRMAVLRHMADILPGAPEATEQELPLLAATEGWPVVTIAEPAWLASWTAEHGPGAVGMTEQAKLMARKLGTTWDQTVELEQLLMAPYVQRAMERQFVIMRRPMDVRSQERNVLVASEVRVWRSILAPIYLQLFEGLQRITEGEPGAAVCRECGQPFVVLDARRRLFCNARERYRFTQRQRRRRLAGAVAEADDPELVDGTEA